MMGNGAPSVSVSGSSAALALTAQFMLFPSLAESLGIDPILISTLHWVPHGKSASFEAEQIATPFS
jgi:hypothetical protein